MGNLSCILFLFLCLAGGVQAAEAAPKTRTPGTMNANLTFGRKWLPDKAGWRGFGNHDEWGPRFDYRRPTWPVAIAVDFSQSAERRDGTIVDENGKELTGHIRAETLGGNFGFRKIFGDSRMGPSPYAGGGLALGPHPIPTLDILPRLKSGDSCRAQTKTV